LQPSSRRGAGAADSQRARSGGRISLAALGTATAVTWTAALALVFFYAPLDAEQGFLQKIFYVHVPMAIVSLGGFVLGGIFAIQHLRTREARWDYRSYVAIHISLVFGLGTLITGSIWAKGSWGHWWVWNEPTLVSFLIVFLLYATYQPLRFAIEDPERQARYASVFAITAGAFVPLNFIAVRLSTAYVHPRVLGSTSNLPGSMAFTFVVCLAAMALLYATLCRFELAAKRTRAQLRALRRLLAGEAAGPRQAAGRSAAPSLHPTPAHGAASGVRAGGPA
jgi:heme exporter protein C